MSDNSERPLIHATGDQRCLWAATAPDPPPSECLSAELAADVVVIGAGFTGLSAALHLAQHGANTVLLEAKGIGYGGSGRNVGLVNAGLWIRPSAVLQRLGGEYGRRLIALLSGAPALVFDLIARHGMQCEAVHTGTLHCAPDRRGELDLRQRTREWLDLGAPVRLLNREETAALTGATTYRCALLDQRAGSVQPLAYARGLAAAAVASGARLFTQSKVIGWRKVGASWQVETERGRVRADWVVVATGAYTMGLAPELRAQQVHLPYFNFATDPLPDELRTAVLPGRLPIWDTRVVLRSFRLDRDGRLVVGSVGSLAGWDAGIHRTWALRTARQTFPKLGRVEFPYAWDGAIDMTSDRLPHLHQLGPQVIGITGYNGRGIGPGSIFGRELARYVSGKLREEELPLRFSTPHSVTFRGLREGLYRLGSAAVHALA